MIPALPPDGVRWCAGRCGVCVRILDGTPRTPGAWGGALVAGCLGVDGGALASGRGRNTRSLAGDGGRGGALTSEDSGPGLVRTGRSDDGALALELGSPGSTFSCEPSSLPAELLIQLGRGARWFPIGDRGRLLSSASCRCAGVFVPPEGRRPSAE